MAGDLNRNQFWRYPQAPTEQMKMFMSAREIKGKYAPLPGDREEVDDWMDGDDPDAASTIRDETDDEFWERKATEAEFSENDYGGQSLYESVAEHGVRKPVHLQARDPKEPRGHREDPREHILGGHHRIAIMDEARPDDLMAVLHHRTIFDAQGGVGWAASNQNERNYPYS